jgi:hypothetical protein
VTPLHARFFKQILSIRATSFAKIERVSERLLRQKHRRGSLIIGSHTSFIEQQQPAGQHSVKVRIEGGALAAAASSSAEEHRRRPIGRAGAGKARGGRGETRSQLQEEEQQYRREARRITHGSTYRSRSSCVRARRTANQLHPNTDRL